MRNYLMPVLVVTGYLIILFVCHSTRPAYPINFVHVQHFSRIIAMDGV